MAKMAMAALRFILMALQRLDTDSFFTGTSLLSIWPPPNFPTASRHDHQSPATAAAIAACQKAEVYQLANGVDVNQMSCGSIGFKLVGLALGADDSRPAS